MTLNIINLVKRKIDENKTFAFHQVRSLRIENSTEAPTAFRKLFPELDRVRGGIWSNLPIGVPLTHYLVLGVPPVFDLEPLTPDKFEEKHGMMIKAVEDLVDRGRILPNLYVRDPKKWSGMEHLEGLVKKALVNGERVDQFLRAIAPTFEELTRDAQRLECVGKALSKNTDSAGEILRLSRQKSLDDVPRVVCHQWAYFDALQPKVSKQLGQLIECGNLIDGLKFSRIMRRIHVSPLTAALGGEWVWGPFDIDQWWDLDTTLKPDKRFSVLERVLDSTIPEAFKFLIEELANISGTPLLDSIPAQKIIQLHQRDDWPELKSSIFSLLRDLTKAAAVGTVDGGKTCRLRELVQEERSLLWKYELGGMMIGRAGSSLAGWSLGTLLNAPLMGALFGSLVPLFDVGSKRAAGWVHELVRTDQHRILVKLDQVKAAAR